MDELERNYKEAMAQHNETIATSIARRLRDRGVCSTAQNSCRNDYACESGADVIETLQARVEVLEKALRPFALAAEKGSNVYVGVKQAMADYPSLFSYSTAYIDAGRSVAHSCLTWNDYREARAALDALGFEIREKGQ